MTAGDGAERSSTVGTDYVAEAKKAFRGPASACLSLEIIIVPLALLIMDKVEGGLTPAKIAWVVVLTVGMIVAIARFSRPWGLPLALGLQVLMLLGWIVSPSLGVLGVVFCLVWAGMLWMRHEVLRRRAQWAAGSG
ncbi:hypothetical protein Acsp06_34040 [Actinomycetospora sp. NBRC 106375]|uniref:DUF4233 domain-containing protein n=1 Tax=Actinomycetospora sp. NBRC 106375 TaxID=3032207 RepID=UPI0024A17071|nr:DUF4233 domain-containing protein [Actinomycetospora sp. NBRC 106375]GLZ47219.1 hypothetical protein Acsp06_34040 [Actinomycetospora sp. NBRC 106375]